MSDSSRPTAQDRAVTDVKRAAKLLLALLDNRKGKKKGDDDRENAANYVHTLKDNLPKLFEKRWEHSRANPLWNTFLKVWNKGDCSWTEAYAALKPLNKALQESN